MTDLSVRGVAKRLMGYVPFTAEVIQRARPARVQTNWHYRLDRLEAALPGWVGAAQAARTRSAPGRRRRVLVVGYLQWWLEYACALSLLLAGLGHQVDLAFLPHRRWNAEVGRFDLRRQRVYLRGVLGRLKGLVGVVDLAGGHREAIPAEVEAVIARQSRIDVQYTGLRERIDLGQNTPDAELLRLRTIRNRHAAGAMLAHIKRHPYDVIVIPNGSILEFAAIFQAARYARVPVVTYEFGEQRDRMWLAQDDEVMRLDTSGLWSARGEVPLTESETQALEALYRARRGGRLWAGFRRQWQAGEGRGSEAARRQLGLDPRRPIALLCTNVVGDSLALGREVFTDGMADWLSQTVRHFASRPQAQLVVRVHPAEQILVGDPSTEIVQEAVPVLPPHVVVIPPEAEVNTYDLFEIADVGLSYTTTVGMEMAMAGIPVIVSGRSHYRGKGFTLDPESSNEYFSSLDRLLEPGAQRKLGQAQVDLARRYAYRFFFEYPYPFPWHLVGFWEDIAERPLDMVLREENREAYAATLRALIGEPTNWSGRSAVGGPP
jgi:hypothetical protein